MTVTGNYTQNTGGVFQIATNGSSYGKLIVGGNATLGGTASVNVASSNTLYAGQVLTSVVYTTGGVGGTKFTSVTDNNPYFDFVSVINGNAIDFNVISQGITNPTPLLSGNTTLAVLSAMQGANKVIQARQDNNLGMSTGDSFEGDKKMWAKTFGSFAEQGDRKGAIGFDANTYGMIIGMDANTSATNRIGAAFAFSHSNIDANPTAEASTAKVSSYQGIVYGSHRMSDQTEFNYQGDLGWHSTNGRRTYNSGADVANSDYNSYSFHLGTGVSSTYNWSARTTFTPSIRADYTWMHDRGYTETGTGSSNLIVDGRNTDQLILSLGGKLAYKANDTTTLLANLGAGYDALGGKNLITASLAGGGTAFTTAGIDPSPWIGYGGLGLAFKDKSGMTFTLRYDIEARKDFTNQSVSAKLRWAF